MATQARHEVTKQPLQQQTDHQPLNRRRALRVLGTLTAVAGAAVATRPEQAAADAGVTVSGGSTANYGIYAGTTGVGRPAVTTGVRGVLGMDNDGSANFALPHQAGVQGAANGSIGVVGTTNATGVGMEGIVTAEGPLTFNNTTAGVIGTSTTSTGVAGASSAVHGIVGQTAASGSASVANNGINPGPGLIPSGVVGIASNGGIGIQGRTSTAANGQPAVLGVNTSGGPGVQGFSSGAGSIGISGGTDVGVGFWGTANGSGVGVLGSSISGTGLWGQSQSFFAGVFSGPVLVQGNFTVTGGKSAAVRGADGGLKRLYCLESPESWFEDFGSGQLNGGSATVALETGFAAVVKTDIYHVFLTPKGEPKGILYVSKQTPGSFTVTEADGGTSNIGFSYRIVAKRKDIEGARLEHVDEPPKFELPPLPTPPATPAPAPGPGGRDRAG
jgi:hypothetical protein